VGTLAADPSLVFLGSQKPTPDMGAALADAGVTGKVALVTAGWQERESDDQELIQKLGVPATNLRLHARSEEVFAADKELAEAHKARQSRLRLIQDFYRIRLDHAFEAAHAISVRHVDPEILAEERTESVLGLRQLDEDHIARCRSIHAAFERKWRPSERAVVAKHRRELATILAESQAIVVMGGHVVSLLNRLRLFDLIGLTRGQRWFAAAAGAMVLCERIYLFHDFPPHGTGIAEVLDLGFGLVKNLVVLPDPRHRISVTDAQGISRFVQRIAPSTCVAMDAGARVFVEHGEVTKASCHRLGIDGHVELGWTG
jgi:hypothetical protein